MSAVTLDNIGQLPRATKPAEGVNYRALTGELMRIRGEMPRVWPTLAAEQRAHLYGLALKSVTTKPSSWQIIRTAPKALRLAFDLHRNGQVEDLFEYGRTLELVWNDILSASENEHLAFKETFDFALEELHSTESSPVLQTRAEIDEWLRSLV